MQTRIHITTKGDKLIISFEQPAQWVGLAAADALKFGQMIIKNARELLDNKPETPPTSSQP